jgi:hypothetical protein
MPSNTVTAVITAPTQAPAYSFARPKRAKPLGSQGSYHAHGTTYTMGHGYTYLPPSVATLAAGLLALPVRTLPATIASLPLGVRTQVAAVWCQLAEQGSVQAAHAMLHMWGQV